MRSIPQDTGRVPLDAARVLQAIAEATAVAPSDRLLPALLARLCALLGVRCGLVAETAGEGRARTLALHTPDGMECGGEWELAATACAAAAEEEDRLHVPEGARSRFPGDGMLASLGIEGLLCAPLRDPGGRLLGFLAVFDAAPLACDPEHESIFRIIAARAATELARLAGERTLGESEERFRDLFDEAPIAYVLEELDTRFIRANHAARRAFGIEPHEVEGTYGTSFVVDNPENRKRLKEAFESVGRGTDTSGVVLELRRRNGEPLWIQCCWSRNRRASRPRTATCARRSRRSTTSRRSSGAARVWWRCWPTSSAWPRPTPRS